MSLEFIKQLNEFVIDSLLNATDDEILSLLDTPDYPTQAEVGSALEIVKQSIKKENNRRLEQAKTEFANHKLVRNQSITSQSRKSIASMLGDIVAAMQRTDEVPEGMLMAFRNQESSSDEDIIQMWQDLVDLGLIKSQDENPG